MAVFFNICLLPFRVCLLDFFFLPFILDFCWTFVLCIWVLASTLHTLWHNELLKGKVLKPIFHPNLLTQTCDVACSFKMFIFFPFWLQFCQISPTAYSLFNFLKRAILLSRALILLLRKSSWIMTNMDLGIKNAQDLKFLTTLNT